MMDVNQEKNQGRAGIRPKNPSQANLSSREAGSASGHLSRALDDRKAGFFMRGKLDQHLIF